MAVLSLLSSVADQIKTPGGLWGWMLKIFQLVPNFAVSIIVVTILLKLVLSPLDFFQKYKMKKNQRISEKLAPEIEKLQKHYGDDKQGFQQKQMQLQRAAGFSYFSSCIPMILTLVIFFTFFAGMRSISQYEEFKQYVARYDIYTSTYTDLTGLDFNKNTYVSDITVDYTQFNRLINLAESDLSGAYKEYIKYSGFKEFYDDYLRRQEERNYYANTIRISDLSDSEQYSIDIKKAGSQVYDLTKLYNFDYAGANQAQRADYDKAISNVCTLINSRIDGASVNPPQSLPNPKINGVAAFKTLYENLEHFDRLKADYVPKILAVAEDASAQAVYEDYRDKQPKFIWIKSIWIADVPWSKAVLDYSAFEGHVSTYINDNKGNLGSDLLSTLKNDQTYNKVMIKVRADDKLSGTNGYLILAILAVGLSFLSQFITGRQQKKSGQVATQGATFKMMMYIMPIMTGVFALMSTAAFSLYMIANSLMTLLINLLTSAALGLINKKKNAQEVNESGVMKYGRKDPNDYINNKKGGGTKK